jgi:hypothetical protein
MNKLSIRRVFIKYLYGLYFEVCGITNPKDRFGEYYLKIVFPKYDYTKLIAQERDKNFKPTTYEELKTRVEDFTYHYNGGVAHYKTTLPGHMDQIHKLPTLQTSKGLNLITYTIFTLTPMKPYDLTKIHPTDLVLKYPFNDTPRDIQILLSNDSDVKITNVGSAKLLSYITFPLDEAHVYMTIVDNVRTELNTNPTIVTQLYRATDPTEFLRKPEDISKSLPKKI